MLLSSALPSLPPPPTSLLPPLNPSSDDPSVRGHGSHHSNPHGAQHHAQARRQKPTANPRGTLSVLSVDERQLSQRKLAIAMYGYSWLKPAGCSKTMLGRREEELEREEVERQLRDVEMQERMAAEADELDRQAERQADGDAAGVEDRDLDDEVPEAAEEGGQWGAEYSDGEVDQDDGMRDLDDDIPSAEEEPSDVFSDDSQPEPQAQSSPQRDSWTYDTRREPSTPSSAGGRDGRNNIDPETDAALHRIRAQARAQRQAGYQRRPGAPGSDYDVDERDAEAMALAEEMLDEDELGDTSFSSNHNGHRHSYNDSEAGSEAERDLDDSVPEADEQDEGEWEHTDSDEEMPLSSEAQAHGQAAGSEGGGADDEDEEMDISILPAQNQQARARRSEGHQMLQATQQDYADSSMIQDRNTPRRGAAGRVVSGNAAISSSAAMSRSHQRRHGRESSAMSSSVASSTTAAGPRRSANSSSRIPSSGVAGSRRGLRSQAQQVQQMASFETPQAAGPDGASGYAVAGIPRTGTLLGTDSSFGMGMSTAGTFEAIDSIRQPHNTHIASQIAVPSQEQDQGQQPAANSRRGWLNPSAARRNLFGLGRPATAAFAAAAAVGGGASGAGSNNNSNSGGLFTPEGLPSHSLPIPIQGRVGMSESPEQSPEPGSVEGGSPSGSQSPGRQTRSGRLLAGFARRAGRGQQGGGGGGQ